MAKIMTQGEYSDEEILDVDAMMKADPFEQPDEKEILQIVQHWAGVNKNTLHAENMKTTQPPAEALVGDHNFDPYVSDEEIDIPYTSEDDDLLQPVPSEETVTQPRMIEVAIEPFDESSSLDGILEEDLDASNYISIEFEGIDATPCTPATIRRTVTGYKDAQKIFSFGKLLKKTTKEVPPKAGPQQQPHANSVPSIPKQATPLRAEPAKNKKSAIPTKTATTTTTTRTMKGPTTSAVNLDSTFTVRNVKPASPRNVSKAPPRTAAGGPLRSQGTSLELRQPRNSAQQQTARHVERLAMKKPSQVPSSIYQRSNTFTIESAQIKKEQQKRKDEAGAALATARRAAKRPTQK